VYKRNPPVSMLITNMQAQYFKKATGKIVFTCEEGKLIADIIEKTIDSNTPQNISVTSVGRNEANEIVAEFIFTWSFKVKGA
jgi:hypothetical protein